MFGRQAIRLLREAWGGKLSPDAEGSFREKGAKQLAEELYSMFDDDIPLEHDGPITINKGSNATPLTINNNSGGPSMTVAGPADFTGDFTVGGTGDVTIAGDTITIGRGADGEDGEDGADGGEGASDVEMRGGALDLDFGEITIGGVPLGDYINGVAGEGGGGALLGIVTSGSDQTYAVDLYADGYDEASTSSVTGVKAPAVATGEEVDAGTKLPVFLVDGTHYIFPPVWL